MAKVPTCRDEIKKGEGDGKGRVAGTRSGTSDQERKEEGGAERPKPARRHGGHELRPSRRSTLSIREDSEPSTLAPAA